MPNWTSNQLTTTNPEIITKLRECEATGNDNILDAFVPMPKGLKGISTGGATTADGVYVRKWRVGPDKEILPIPADESEALLEAHGTDDWYEWSVRNWGTKWDSCNPVFDFTDDTAIVTFDSPSADAWDQGWFFDDGAHDLDDPRLT